MEQLTTIKEILKRVIISGYVTNAQPLSTILIAPAGAGKTATLKQFYINKNLLVATDITPYGFAQNFSEIKNKKVTHIIIPDLTQIFSRSDKIVNNTIGFLNALIEEGIYYIKTFYIELKEEIKLGLITSTTTADFFKRRKGWLGIGFLSRLLPITYQYATPTAIDILNKIASTDQIIDNS